LKNEYDVKKGAIIELYKYIPDGAGLGGGSSNAATTFKALNKLWDLKISNKNLEKLAIQIGSDVPFFIKSKFGRITKKGEKIHILKRPKKYWYVIVVPKKCKVKTALAYKWFDEDFVLTKNTTCSKIILSYKLLHNDLENVVLKRRPLLRKIKEKLICFSHNEKMISLSGSGSAIFSLCETKERAKYIFNKIKGALINCEIYLAHSI
jgi:4-diphosphocytidyl-2C-methyl-D-erythritol kinase